MHRGAWRATVQGVAKSRTQLSIHTHTHTVLHPMCNSEINSKWFIDLNVWAKTIYLLEEHIWRKYDPGLERNLSYKIKKKKKKERNLSYKIKAEVIKKLHFIKITNSQASENAVRKGGISENGRVKNLLKENTDRNCQNQLVFRTLKINQRLVVIWETFIEEK